MRSPEMSTRRISSQSRAPGRETVHVSRPEKQLLPYLSTTASSDIQSLFTFFVVLMVTVDDRNTFLLWVCHFPEHCLIACSFLPAGGVQECHMAS